MLTTTKQMARAAKHWRTAQKAAQGEQWTTAEREFEQAVKFAPNDAGSWHGLAVARVSLSRMLEGTEAAKRAFELAPDSVPACKTLMECLIKQNRFDEAVAVIDDLAPEAERDHDLLVGYATALFAARRPGEAVAAFVRALALNLASPIAHFRMGLAFKDLFRDRDANLCFGTALATDTTGKYRALILSQLVYGSRLTCEWELIDDHTTQLLAAIDTADDETSSQLVPFTLLALDTTPAQQLRVGRLTAASTTRHMTPLPEPGLRRPGRVRVGYLSADFSNHATALLITELLERRDTGRFEVFLYSHSPEDGSEIQARVRRSGDHYIDVSQVADIDVAKRMRADGLDIVVDLKGHTRDSRYRLLGYRPAPVQVAYLGYPGTSGADFIDYLIGDPVVTPLQHAPNYSEKIAQLPGSYQPNDRHRVLPPAPARAVEGLPEDAVVLCCFNQTYKISPRMLDLWARILAGAPNAVLWMLTWAQEGHVNLSRELQARGVDLDRVLFAPRVTVEAHIARMRCADLFLDTWPCNAHTTASEALWAGVPVLTVPGATFASRVAASLVAACGQPEMACKDEEDYVNTAIRLANAPDELKAAKAHLESNRMNLPLFDTDRYARGYEALLMRMFERRQAGLAPDHLAAEATPEVEAKAESGVTAVAVTPAEETAPVPVPIELQADRPVVTFCIPTYNRARYLKCLLESLAPQLAKFPYAYEVLVSDNGSPDATQEVLAEFADRMVLRATGHETNRGNAANWHHVMTQARGTYVIYIADDDGLMIDAAARVIATLLAQPSVGIAYAPWVLYNRVTQQHQGQFYRQDRDILLKQGDHRALLDSLLRYGAFPEICVCRRELLLQVMPRIHEQAFYAFVHAAEYLHRADMLLLKDPYYVSITDYFAGEQRSQEGHGEAEYAWDRYRGGLEHLLGRATGVSDAERTGFCLRIQQVVAERMAVAVRLRVSAGRDAVETYYLAYRLKALGQEKLLHCPLDYLRLRAAMDFPLRDVELNRDIAQLLIHGEYDQETRDYFSKHSKVPVTFDSQPLTDESLVAMRDTLVVTTSDIDPIGPALAERMKSVNVRLLTDRDLLEKFVA